ncbi:MAG TPA: GGDEF domain-containing protein [Candidatus Limnocylindria bacterium]|nr:GGDEF domain-containing protein [Candidatus Limnocylindria bacterium]
MSTGSSVAEVAATLGVVDLMVFELGEGGARLRGGVGRGAGWAGIVDVALADEPALHKVANGERILRIAEDSPVRVIGPYWSAHAAVVRVGEHVVVAGSDGPIRASSAELMTRATEAIASVGEIPSSKLLADELELAEAVRQLTTHTPHSLAEAARHVAATAADALSCEIGVVLLQRDGMTEVHGAGAAWPTMVDDEVLCASLHDLADRATRGPIVEQDLAAVGRSGLRIVSCYALGIGRTEAMGALIVGHTDARPRGFTLLCQRVGRALADAAEPALRLAIAHEDLAAQRDRFAREARTDPLTELANRVAWEETLTVEQARRERHPRPVVLLAVDIDGLKGTNDSFGHAAGDELLIAAAGVLRDAVRAGDVVARIGGDEFVALLADADPTAAEAVRRRVMAACDKWPNDRGLRLRLSIGWASPEEGETLRDAFRRADAAMYQVKRGAA